MVNEHKRKTITANSKAPALSGAFFLCAGVAYGYPITEKPPSTGIAVPVTKSEAGEARNTAMPAKSSMSPQRPAGVRASTRSCRPSICCARARVRSVSIQPGRIALTWMLSAAQATARRW